MIEERKTQTDTSDGLDALFRNSLENQQIEPSKAIWKGISRKLLRTELAHLNFINLPKTFWIGTASVFIVGLIFLLTQIPNGKTTRNDHSPVIIKDIPQGNLSVITSNTQLTRTDKKLNSGTTHSVIKALPKNSTVQPTQLPSGVPFLARNNSTPIIKTNGTTNTATFSSGITSLTLSGKEVNSFEGHLVVSRVRNINSYELNYLPSLTITSLFPSTYEDTLLRIANFNGIINIPVSTKSEIPQFFTFNMGVSPELSVYRNNGKYSESNFWLNTGVTYHIGKFSVQTGVGLGYVFDQGDYRVNYKSKDSIGYFTSIISFIVTPGNKIIYTTKDIAVYDSVEHVADSRAISRYTYLQIPVLLGYELFETNRFIIGIKAGLPSHSILHQKKLHPLLITLTHILSAWTTIAWCALK